MALFRLTSTVLDTRDPRGLADFYRVFLGWPVGSYEPTWATLRPADGGAAQVEAAGGVLAEFQPQEKVRVYFDPAGHPFCLWIR